MSSHPGFYDLGIAPNIIAILDKLHFAAPMPIQEKCIPAAIEGKDLIGVAQTGTGKTLAFGVPIVQAALQGKQGLVVLPTRELAMQVNETFEKIGGPLRLLTAVLIGGESISRQVKALRRNPQIVIGTPGRIIDHLEQKTVSLKSVATLVLDEADRMLDMGFAPQLNRILAALPRERQTMLFSATMPQDIVTIAQTQMKFPVRIEVAPSGSPPEKITQELFFVHKQDKPRLLEKIVTEYRGSVLIFARMKVGAKRIAAQLRALGHTAAEIHSNRSLGQRKEALEGFKNRKYRILVATDIAARGIDVKGIELVMNYDLPRSPEDYVHRIGRTGRVGVDGHAISFATPDEKGDVRGIERLIRAILPLSAVDNLPPARIAPLHPSPRPSYSPRQFSGYRGRGNSQSRRPGFRANIGAKPPNPASRAVPSCCGHRPRGGATWPAA